MNYKPRQQDRSIKRNRVLIPLWYSYHLFGYFDPLVESLRDQGLEITVFTFDSRIYEQYFDKGEGITARFGPAYLRFCNNRSRNPICRLLLWIGAKLWISSIRESFDYAIVPWDSSILWYVIADCFPSLYLHFSLEDFKARDTPRIKQRFVLPKDKLGPKEQAVLIYEQFTRKKILPRYRDQLVKYRLSDVIIDRMMGRKGENFFTSCGPEKHIGILGPIIKDSLDPSIDENKVVVTGFPGYDRLVGNQIDWEINAARIKFANRFGIKEGPVFSYFSSHPKIDDKVISELQEVINTIDSIYPKAHVIFKVHPKLSNFDEKKFTSCLNRNATQVYVIKEFGGDKLNAEIMLASDLIMMQFSKLMLMAVALKCAFVMLDFEPRKYQLLDELESYLSIVTSNEGLSRILRDRDNESMPHFRKIVLRYEPIREKICSYPGQAGERIGSLIKADLGIC